MIINVKQPISLDGHIFNFIQIISPKRNNNEQILQYSPQSRYAKRSTHTLNAHGSGSFCKFTISSKYKECSGVYALYSNEKLLYIGESVDVHKRFNVGYGNISPKNCYDGGQPTNCKINKLILDQCQEGKIVTLYLHETLDYKRIEKRLRSKLDPPYNAV